MNKKQCPNCNQYKIEPKSSYLLIGAIVLIFVGMFGLLISRVFGYLLMGGSVVTLLVSIWAGRNGVMGYYCKNCHKSFTNKEFTSL